MKGMLYMQGHSEPVAVLDDIKIVKMNDNHTLSPVRIFFESRYFNTSKVMTELHRDVKMTVRLDDGRTIDTVLQHSSLDMQGNQIGVLRVLGEMPSEAVVTTEAG